MTKQESDWERGSGRMDWSAIHQYLVDMEMHHGVTVRVNIMVAPGVYTTGLLVEVRATAPWLTAPGKLYHHREYGYYPSHEQSTLEGMVYMLLHRLDGELSGAAWKQLPLP